MVYIKAPFPVFNPDEATLMDFRIPQEHGTTFIYTMPFSESEALVEYTVFSKEVQSNDEYNAGLTNYCKNYLNLNKYEILSEEFGIIPMTDYRFPKRINNIINIGTAGGQTKSSSGYTFRFIQKNSAQIASALINTGTPFIDESFIKKRFDLYDSTLLNILSNKKLHGAEIFEILMKNNKMSDVFKFLDNETSAAEELKIISHLPKGVFIKAFFESL